MSLVIENLPKAIRSSKASLRKALPNYSEVFHEIEAEMHRKIAQNCKGTRGRRGRDSYSAI